MTHLSPAEAKDFNIKEFFEKDALAYPKLGTNSGVVVYDDGTIHYGSQVGCHAYMNSFLTSYKEKCPWSGNPKRELKEIYTSLWSHTYDDTVLEYFRFLCNKQYSPWRSILKGSEVLWGKKDEKDIPVAVKLTDMGASGQVVMNFMLACRMAYAQPGLIKSYGELRKVGFTRTEATFLSASFGLNASNTPNWPYIGDYPYDTAFADMDWEMWKSGSPRYQENGELNKERFTRPINAIWNEDVKKKSGIVIVGEHNKKNNRICNLISEEKEITNIFGHKEKRRVPLSFEKAVEALKANEEIWKCKPNKQESTSQVEEPTEKTPFAWTSSSFVMDTLSFAPLATNTTVSSFTAGPSV